MSNDYNNDYLEQQLKESILKYCKLSNNSDIDKLCSVLKSLSTFFIVLKGTIIAAIAILLSIFFQSLVYSQIFLAITTIWYLNKYTTLKDTIVENLLRKNYKEIVEKESEKDEASSVSESSSSSLN